MNGTAGNGSASALFCAYDRRQRDAYETARSGDSTPWSVQLAPSGTSAAAPAPVPGSFPSASSVEEGLLGFTRWAMINVSTTLSNLPDGNPLTGSIRRCWMTVVAREWSLRTFFSGFLQFFRFDLKNRKTGEPLKYASTTWKIRIHMGFTNIHIATMSPSTRLRAWNSAFFPRGVPDELIADWTSTSACSILSGMLLLELIAYAVPFAVLPERFAHRALATASPSLLDDAHIFELWHGELERKVMKYICGFAVHNLLRDVNAFPLAQRDIVKKVVVRCLHGSGPLLPLKTQFGSAVRLARPVDALLQYCFDYEDFVQAFALNPKALLEHGSNVVHVFHELVRTSTFLRGKFAEAISAAMRESCSAGEEPLVVPVETLVMIQERFTRTLNSTRVKTFRQVSGMIAEGESNDAPMFVRASLSHCCVVLRRRRPCCAAIIGQAIEAW